VTQSKLDWAVGEEDQEECYDVIAVLGSAVWLYLAGICLVSISNCPWEIH